MSRDDVALVDWVSKKGVISCLGGAAFSWLSRNSGRDVLTLKAAERVSNISEIGERIAGAKGAQSMLVAVVGRVGSEQPIKCQQSLLRVVILEEIAEQFYLKHMDTGSWVQESALLLCKSRSVPWFLEDSSGRVNVVGAKKAVGLELTVASDVYEEKESSIIRGSIEYVQGIKSLGVKRVEKVLPIGTNLTVVGEAVLDAKGSVQVQKPQKGHLFVSPKSLDQLISNLGKWSRLYKWIASGCTAVGIFWLISHAARKFFELRRREAFRRRVLEAARASGGALIDGNTSSNADMEGAPNGDGALADSGGRRAGGANAGEKEDSSPFPDLCVICLEERYNSVFSSCGHMCCCVGCASQLNQCPLCRRRVEHVIRVYRH